MATSSMFICLRISPVIIASAPAGLSITCRRIALGRMVCPMSHASAAATSFRLASMAARVCWYSSTPASSRPKLDRSSDSDHTLPFITCRPPPSRVPAKMASADLANCEFCFLPKTNCLAADLTSSTRGRTPGANSAGRALVSATSFCMAFTRPNTLP